MNKEFDVKLGTTLRRQREQRKITQEQVADKMGVTKMAVSNWESGKRSMYATTLKDYCAIIGVRLQVIFDEMDAK